MSFRILFRTVLTIAVPVSLSSLPGVERPTASAICFMSSILRRSDFGYFFLYLRCVSTYYSELEFVILATYASQKSHIASYCGWLVLGLSFLWTGLLSIPDLSSESPFLKAASISSSGFSLLLIATSADVDGFGRGKGKIGDRVRTGWEGKRESGTEDGWECEREYGEGKMRRQDGDSYL